MRCLCMGQVPLLIHAITEGRDAYTSAYVSAGVPLSLDYRQ